VTFVAPAKTGLECMVVHGRRRGHPQARPAGGGPVAVLAATAAALTNVRAGACGRLQEVRLPHVRVSKGRLCAS
jgi:hypothetical protein